jgi:hypothetical protein
LSEFVSQLRSVAGERGVRCADVTRQLKQHLPMGNDLHASMAEALCVGRPVDVWGASETAGIGFRHSTPGGSCDAMPSPCPSAEAIPARTTSESAQSEPPPQQLECSEGLKTATCQATFLHLFVPARLACQQSLRLRRVCSLCLQIGLQSRTSCRGRILLVEKFSTLGGGRGTTGRSKPRRRPSLRGKPRPGLGSAFLPQTWRQSVWRLIPGAPSICQGLRGETFSCGSSSRGQQWRHSPGTNQESIPGERPTSLFTARGSASFR